MIKALVYKIAPVCLPVIFVLILSSCSRCSPGDEMYFRINEELLGETYADSLLSIELRIPEGWSDISDEVSDIVSAAYEGSEEDYNRGLIFRKGYGDFENVVFMLLFDFEYEMIDPDKEVAIGVFLADFSETTEVFKQGSYRHNDIRFHQLTSRDGGMISIKLLGYGSGERVFALDYFIPEPIYMNYIETIESSIGSIVSK